MRTLAGILFAAALTVGPALAQDPVSNAPTPPGGIPPASGAAGDRTGSITGTGQTKPPGDTLGGRAGTTPELERKSRQLDREITTGICKGC